VREEQTRRTRADDRDLGVLRVHALCFTRLCEPRR
jgi:hypothetical protein